MERVRRIWWVAILFPGMAWSASGIGVGLAVLVALLLLMAFVVWVDWKDARTAASYETAPISPPVAD